MFSVSVARFLVSSEGDTLIRQAESLAAARVSPVQALTALRKNASGDVAGAAWDMADLRRRAAAKIGPDSARMYFDRDGYEMASAAPCAAYHASLFAAAGAALVVDLCAGVGIDACGFGQAGIDVTGYEIDPARAIFAEANTVVLGLAERVVVHNSDATQAEIPLECEYAFFDPARRQGERKRIVYGDDLVPPLSLVHTLRMRGVTSTLAKLSPAVDRSIGDEIGGDLEFLSSCGECKEALVRTGSLRSGTGVAAVLLDSGTRLDGPSAPPRVDARVGQFVYEPDPAVIRAGLVGNAAASVDGWLFDANVAYVMSDSKTTTPFATGYRVIDSFPYHRKRLQEALNSFGAGRLIVKRRAFPHEPEAIRKQMKLNGSLEATVILTSEGSRLWAVIVERL
ncbi:MAG TPA: hypothetical protein VGK19_00440 [Capsulimonadaceae bacterium]|jgi:hypothetical protein